jgi:hypothetical protein
MACAFVSCSSSSHGIATLPSAGSNAANTTPSAGAISVPANSMASLRAGVRAAYAAGKKPRYVLVKGTKKQYGFPVGAQVVRSAQNVFVRAYNRMYIFKAGSVTVQYAGRTVDQSTLPAVQARGLDSIASALAGQYHDTRGKAMPGPVACVDCSAVLLDPTANNHLDRAWAADLDTWQAHPDYTVSPSLATVQPSPAPIVQHTLSSFMQGRTRTMSGGGDYYGDYGDGGYYGDSGDSGDSGDNGDTGYGDSGDAGGGDFGDTGNVYYTSNTAPTINPCSGSTADVCVWWYNDTNGLTWYQDNDSPNGGGGGGGDGGDTQLALLPYNTGQHCYDSFAAIGDNVPYNTTDSGHNVANIDKIALVNGNEVGMYGYVYLDRDGQLYLQQSASYHGSFWATLAKIVPVVGQLVEAAQNNGSSNATIPITPAQLNQIKAAVAQNQPGMSASVTGCFSNVPAGTPT